MANQGSGGNGLTTDISQLPKVKVFMKNNPVKSRPGLASKVAIIGAFDAPHEKPVLCNNLDEAYEKLGNNMENPSVRCLDKLFYGASSVLAVNITTLSGSGDNITYDYSITPAKLTSALSKIMNEDFDILFLPYENLPEEIMIIITSFANRRFQNKQPIGHITCKTDSTFQGDFCYGMTVQSLIVNDETLNAIETCAYYCGIIASLNVGSSMTMKVLPNVTGIVEEFSFENGNIGLNLLKDGVTVFRCHDRANNKYIVVNSEQPNGLDLYINRTRDFVVKEMSLHQFLGERNRTATLNEIKQELDRVKDRCVNTLDLLEDIEYTVEKKSAKCVDVNITKLLFAGIITEIDVYVTIEVE